MALKFKKPEIKAQRLKMLVYGGEGSGKSSLCVAMPNVAYFDTEDTTSKPKYAKAIHASNSAVINTTDLDEVINQVKALMSEKHDFKTVVIDSLSVPYNKYKRLMERKVGTEWGKNSTETDKKVNDFVELILDPRFDMNVIVTAHAKNEYGSNMSSVIGRVADAPKRFGHMFDLVLETSKLGNVFSAKVHKSRLENFATGEEITLTYEEITKRLAVETLEREAVPVVFGTSEQIAEAKRLVQLLKIEPEETDKWFDKYKCDGFEDMPQEIIVKCIDVLRNKIENREQK